MQSLCHDKPSCKGVENVLKRAKRLVSFQYAPIRPLPILEKIREAKAASYNVETHSPAWLPITGVLYSSVRCLETYFGFNITPETFISALSNPNSVVYRKPITGTGQNVHNHYGIVCSCFVSYCLDVHYRTNCGRWPSLPGIHEVDITKLENIRLADIVLNVKQHIALITDIERDENGNVCYITVSESVIPFVRSTRFNAEQFRNFWLANGYIIYRYDGVKNVSYEPDPFAPVEGDPDMPAPLINQSLMPDFGNKANYRRGEQPVEISVFEEGCKFIEITDPDGEKSVCPVEDGFVIFHPEKTGIYEAACIRSDGCSMPVSWCVTDLIIEPEKKEYKYQENVTLKIKNPGKDIIVDWQYNRRDINKGVGSGWLDLKDETEITIPGPGMAVPVELYLIAKNEYGYYSSRRVPLEITQ